MESKGLLRCKIVVVGDTQCGKTALLHVFAKDSYPENYVPTVFENYTASFEIEKQRIELNMWDTSGSAYYDNVRPLAYPDSDAVLICFDISRPETLDSVLKKWQGETQEFCPNAKVVLVGCKLDMRTDLNVMRELSKHRLIPVTHEQRKHKQTTSVVKYVGALWSEKQQETKHRALTWRGRSVPWPTQNAPQSIQRTASVTYFTSPPCRPCPTSTDRSSNAAAHVAASSGSPSSPLGLRFMSARRL
ncbi:rho-related GTP-binding protein RhoN-like isoform X1 [Acanthochromis polyacanthus]|uniref:rho-related GTP-binding protein RhoN-like isoform X1 n=1 Tax=Acanthochromis polyacanthus TaxID=80966 RepID=UPI002234A6D0|nr:rho-related GTP-binding protein RhoN-like isoform X1 [Acanthochromis polyacanthus]